MIPEMIVWLAVRALLYEVQVLTAILAVSFGYEIVGRGVEKVPLRAAMWRALRSAAVAGALVAVASRVIVNSAVSFVAGQLGDLLLLVLVSMAAGATWRLELPETIKRGADGGSFTLLAEPDCCLKENDDGDLTVERPPAHHLRRRHRRR